MRSKNSVLGLIIIGFVGILGCIHNLQFIQEQELVRVDDGIKKMTTLELARIRRSGDQDAQNYMFHSERPGATYILPEARSVMKMILFVKGKVLNCEIYIHQGQGKWYKVVKQRQQI